MTEACGNKAPMDKLKILFLCTGNACRSQMAEGFARQLRGDAIEAYSAGTNPHGMNPLAIRVMSEAGVDISGGRSKHVDELKDVKFDHVVTVCDNAHETCPMFPGKTKVVHVGFQDPPKLARDAGAQTEEEALPYYRRVRDEIRKWVETLPQSLPPRAEANAR
jgi:arsenate reductase (thioredoxin)